MEAIGENESKWALTCRICLKTDNRNMKCIFGDISLPDDIATKIIKCGGIPVNIFDGMPDRICDRCFLDLEIAYRFRNVCQQSYQRLNEMINTKENKQFRSEDTSITELNDERRHEENSHDKMMNTIENIQLKCEDTTIIEMKDESDTEVIPAEYCDLLELPKQDISEGDAFLMLCIKEEAVVCNSLQESEIDADEIERKSDHSKPTVSINKTKPNGTKFSPKCELNQRKNLARMCKDKPRTQTMDYDCHLCEKVCRTNSNLYRHIRQHTAERPHECKTCGKRFSFAGQLSRHMNCHTGDRPYKCKYCPTSFGDPSNCVKHERIHTNYQPFTCSYCGKTFAYSNVYKVHLKIHTEEKPYSCSICDRKFTQQHHMKLHEKTHLRDVGAGVIGNKTG